jgi:hypothetical protein
VHQRCLFLFLQKTGFNAPKTYLITIQTMGLRDRKASGALDDLALDRNHFWRGIARKPQRKGRIKPSNREGGVVRHCRACRQGRQVDRWVHSPATLASQASTSQQAVPIPQSGSM